MDRTHSFGYWLRRRRKALDLTQEQLARQVGCALETIKKIETDVRRPSRQMAERLADVLQVGPGERAAFISAARAELAADQITLAIQPLAGDTAAAPEPNTPLPSGTVTFLFTDIEASTRLWVQHPQGMPAVLARQEAILRAQIAAHGGMVFKTLGDGVCAVFGNAPSALSAALAAQRALQAEPWSALVPMDSANQTTPGAVAVRMALHTGTATLQAGEYAGYALSRIARLLAIGHGGQLLLSQVTQELVRNHLPPDVALRDLGVHCLKDLRHSERIFQVVVPDLPADFPPLGAPSARRHNLPLQLTSFVGREQELAEIAHLLASTRLLTLTGPGGTGKTRLALELAAALLADTGRFPDGVWLVELAPLADPALVPQAVASALDLRGDAGRPLLATLTEFLRAKDLLLIVDNCEHVLEACAQLADALLRACPKARILASSREALGIAGEVVWRVPPLGLPPLDPSTAHNEPDWVSALAQYEAIRLFIERAAAVQPSFSLTTQNAGAVAQVCRRLDGIPLAIELAAVRLRVLSVEQIAARLDDRFRLLTGGSRAALPRHQTLRGLIDWSYDLLTPEEQALLQRLTVFAGGWTLEAADAVMQADGDGLRGAMENAAPDVLDGLAHLADKSLVGLEEQGGSARYTMLETIRQYAAARLETSGKVEAVRRRHADYYLVLAEAAEGHLHWKTAEQGVWLARLEVEHDNLRAALAWSHSVATGAELELRLVTALAQFWILRDFAHEGWTYLQKALIRRGNVPAAVRLGALGAVILFGQYTDNLNQTTALAEEGFALAQTLGDSRRINWFKGVLGMVAENRGDYQYAKILFEEALTNYQAVGDTEGVAVASFRLGRSTYMQGDSSRAITLLEQSLAICRESAVGWAIARRLAVLGLMELGQNSVAQAAGHLREGLNLCLAIQYKEDMVTALIGLAGVAGALRQPAQAIRLFGAAEALHQTSTTHFHPFTRAEYNRNVAAARAKIDDETFAAAWSAGRAMTLEQAVAEALAALDEVQPTAAVPGGSEPVPLVDDLAHEVALAAEIQHGLLPASLPQPPGWRIAAALLPARETAGDFYDCFLLPDGRLALVIADVSGKGLGAALYMATGRALIRTLVPLGITAPAAVLAGVNARLLEDTHAGLFITAFFGVLDLASGTLTYANAGHPPPLLMADSAGGVVQLLNPTGLVLGVEPGASWCEETVVLGVGDRLLLYTDGVTEAQDGGGAFFETAQLLATLAAGAGEDAEAVVARVRAAVLAFAGAVPQFDDITLLAVQHVQA